MEIEKIELDPNDTRVVHEPTIRFAPAGGCGLPGCNCSPDPFLTVTDGKTLLSVKLEPDEVRRLISGRHVILEG